MRTVATYLRYSSEDQRGTSIDDQLRRCRETAEKNGLTIDDSLVFMDKAVSGTAAGRGKRHGYSDLIAAIEARRIDVLVIDEVSRAGRTAVDNAMLFELIENTGTRLITADGVDSASTSWKLMSGIKSLMATHEVEAIASRVVRGMIGQLDRGYQIAQAPYGYNNVKVTDHANKIAAKWEINEEKAAIVRKVYDMRVRGLSLRLIARTLNDDGILPPAPKRCKGAPFWRPGTVFQLLANKIYKGIFVWNGSSFTRTKAAKKRKEVITQDFEREHLRLVSDDVWEACNSADPQRKVRGGGSHALAGILRCGQCGAALSIKGSTNSPSAYCPQCEQLKGVGVMPTTLGYASMTGIKLALNYCLRQLFTGEVQAEFRERLRKRLTEGTVNEQSVLQEALRKLNRGRERISRLLCDENVDERWLRGEISNIGKQIDDKTAQVEALKKRNSHVTAASIEAQVNVDPLPLLEKLLENPTTSHVLRATLKRLITRFNFVGRNGRFQRTFEIEFVPGVWLAEVSNTPAIENSTVGFSVTVSTTGKRPAIWKVKGHRL